MVREPDRRPRRRRTRSQRPRRDDTSTAAPDSNTASFAGAGLYRQPLACTFHGAQGTDSLSRRHRTQPLRQRRSANRRRRRRHALNGGCATTTSRAVPCTTRSPAAGGTDYRRLRRTPPTRHAETRERNRRRVDVQRYTLSSLQPDGSSSADRSGATARELAHRRPWRRQSQRSTVATTRVDAAPSLTSLAYYSRVAQNPMTSTLATANRDRPTARHHLFRVNRVSPGSSHDDTIAIARPPTSRGRGRQTAHGESTCTLPGCYQREPPRGRRQRLTARHRSQRLRATHRVPPLQTTRHHRDKTWRPGNAAHCLRGNDYHSAALAG